MTVVTGSVTRIGMGAVPYLMPLLFQVGFGLSAFKSGLLLLASAVGNLGMKALTTRILQRWGFRAVSIVDVAIAAAATGPGGAGGPRRARPGGGGVGGGGGGPASPPRGAGGGGPPRR